MVAKKRVNAILILWVLLVCSLTRAIESDIKCLSTLKSQLKDPNGHLSNWAFGNINNSEGHYICKFSGVHCWNDEEGRVLSIDFGGFGLEGEFPSGVKECSSLAALNLTSNNLSGTLPPGIVSFLPYITTLDLSYNNFSGRIPATWSNFPFLDTLLLDHNRFTGHIPPGLLSNPRLKIFSVADNHLQGQIPEFSNGYIYPSSFDDNPELCGFPLDDPCEYPLSSMVIIIAASTAAVFFPVGAALGWFYIAVGQEQKIKRPRRR